MYFDSLNPGTSSDVFSKISAFCSGLTRTLRAEVSYSAAYVNPTRGEKRFTTSEVAADWRAWAHLQPSLTKPANNWTREAE